MSIESKAYLDSVVVSDNLCVLRVCKPPDVLGTTTARSPYDMRVSTYDFHFSTHTIKDVNKSGDIPPRVSYSPSAAYLNLNTLNMFVLFDGVVLLSSSRVQLLQLDSFRRLFATRQHSRSIKLSLLGALRQGVNMLVSRPI
ncbi:hypothetical protein D9619_003713 [Psilocybe cf. subviscida]|uniref:Uncharacterized protein n=1 Tax=Psilocybe cf. subviscida TaxID=2480587 RepID=A0A8H5AWK1_9AGAR|nr:hypothetical protein D9619_003713 [Psilocybe cf. subviscida]